MARPTDAIVTGFTRNAALCEASFASLRALKNAGILRRVVYVTWASEAIDPYLVPVKRMKEIELVRVPEPTVSGSPNQRGVLYQVHNLERALAQIPDEDVLVLKTRPDFIADAAFLNGKIAGFDTLCAPYRAAPGDLPLPALPLKAKMWIPWADANQPFFYEDATCLGLKSDIAQLVTPQIGEKIGVLENPACGPYAHVVRFGSIFRKSMPIFDRYLREYRFFPNDMEYRSKLIPAVTQEAFFWHLVIAHACLLAACFHVDCGEQGDLSFYPNTGNGNADWSSFGSLKLDPPYDHVDDWRDSVTEGQLLSGVGRLYGRLMDDRWQRSVLAGKISDTAHASLEEAMKHACLYKKGVLSADEDKFYGMLAAFHKAHGQKRDAA